MSTAPFVRRRLATLRAALDANGAVVSSTLRDSIEHAQADSGMPPGARAVVVIRPPKADAILIMRRASAPSGAWRRTSARRRPTDPTARDRVWS